MSNPPEHQETFESFKKSFFYGSRSDMSFKFLAHLSDDQASDFFTGLLARIVDAYDSGTWRRYTSISARARFSPMRRKTVPSTIRDHLRP